MAKPTPHERAVQTEFEALRAEQTTRLAGGTAAHRLNRLIVRILRVAAGFALILLAVYSCSEANTKSSISLASLTLADLASMLLGYGAAIALTVGAFQAAFGEGPRPDRTSEASLRIEAERRVADREQQFAVEAARAAHEEERIAAKYRRSRLLGLLFDPGIAKRHKWLPWVAWPLAYLIPLLVIKLLS